VVFDDLLGNFSIEVHSIAWWPSQRSFTQSPVLVFRR
jgi:hypothetical protein